MSLLFNDYDFKMLLTIMDCNTNDYVFCDKPFEFECRK